jgi:hypothetical protein
MTYNEIYKILLNFIFDYNKLFLSTQNNLIIIIDNVKQHEAQIGYFIKIHNVSFFLTNFVMFLTKNIEKILDKCVF